MGSQFWPKTGSPGILHHFTETLVTFEFTPSPSPTHRTPHSILFLGGLGDGLATTSYVSSLIPALASTPWSLFTLTLTSSYSAWGFGHLDRDTDEIAACIRHIQAYKRAKYGLSPGNATAGGGEGGEGQGEEEGKIVVMGHSTGSQCVLHYLSRPNPHTSHSPWDRDLEHIRRPILDGAIMQAPVSDREAIKLVMRDGFLGRTPAQLKETYDTLVRMAREQLDRDGDGNLDGGEEEVCDAMLPVRLTAQFGYPRNTPVSCRRFWSLVSPESPGKPAEDDMFSSDLGDGALAETFGRVAERGLVRGKLMVLMSGADQAVPEWVDKEGLLERWRKVTDRGGKIWDRERSGLIPGASHALSNDDQAEPRAFLVKRVLSFLEEVAARK
ncbi:uncharacterized protein C8A04DRAFT_8926 [Dichotomopilus funicola]|uniref:Uncharacterized protein n=1 Tax=Dichotomopilus funicola TaxID=1934379 RepID=A0AAN6ZSB3_9PEZI|nr:hypothetical protein C8A04DRAFT_8926 [Dichotomopilus funicola]